MNQNKDTNYNYCLRSDSIQSPLGFYHSRLSKYWIRNLLQTKAEKRRDILVTKEDCLPMYILMLRSSKAVNIKFLEKCSISWRRQSRGQSMSWASKLMKTERSEISCRRRCEFCFAGGGKAIAICQLRHLSPNIYCCLSWAWKGRDVSPNGISHAVSCSTRINALLNMKVGENYYVISAKFYLYSKLLLIKMSAPGLHPTSLTIK